MSQALTQFEPTRSAALARLQAFVPLAAHSYAARRNYDLGAGQHEAVSTLSPYLRTRLITEADVLGAVLGRYAPSSAEKFVQEVYWRTYFKGWLEQRPAIWTQYQSGLMRALDEVQSRAGMRQVWEDACSGNTGIACFDHWANELQQTGYLHNHARMWFASIWIFTLRLPWELGADFFLRHLLDGDPASNTLSWRWVGGLHTQGKHYLARTSNIKRYTDGRFDPSGQLNEEAQPLPFSPHPDRETLPADEPIPDGARVGLILHDDDLSPNFLFKNGLQPVATATFFDRSALSPLHIAPHVTDFVNGAIQDTVARWADRLGSVTPCTNAAQLAEWADRTDADVIVTTYAPVGPIQDTLTELQGRLTGKKLYRRLRPYDANAWPHATAGFFKVKKQIPQLIEDLKL